MEAELSKIILPNSNIEIATRLKADLDSSSAQLNAGLKSLFESNKPVEPQPAGPHPSAGSALPKHSLGAFRDRLRATLRNIVPSSK
jgi:hypothetical protein